MKKFLIWFAVFVAVVIGILVLLIPRLVNVEQYRGKIETAIRERSGLEPSLGSITLKLLPTPSLRIHPLALRDPKGRLDVAGADLSIRAELKPLLHRTLVIQRIEILHPQVRLTRKNGVLALPALPAQPAAAPAAGGGGFGVRVARVEIRNGTLTVAAGPGRPAWGLSGISVELSPETGTFGGRGALNAGGALSWTGSLGKSVVVTLDRIPSAALGPWLPEGMVRAGEIVSGTVTVAGASSATAHLELAGLMLLSGTHPLDHATADLTVKREPDGWRLAALTFGSRGATIRGSGRLTPALDLTFTAGSTPIERVLTMAHAVFPVPLNVKSPGTFTGSLRLAERRDGTVTMSARGAMSAAAVTFSAGMPALEKVRTRFELTRSGSLVLPSVEASVFGGVLAGRAVLTRLDPPGELQWTGTLKGADLGRAIAALAPRDSAAITGKGDLDAKATIDLSRPELDARALSGTATVTARDLVLPGWNITGALHDLGTGKTDLLGMLASLKSGSSAGTAAGEEGGGSTAFSRATARADFRRIPWKLSDISVQSEDLSARGAGTFDPVAGTLRLALTAYLSKAVTRRLVSRAAVLKNLRDARGRLVLPLDVAGPVASPKIGFDLGRALARKHPASTKGSGGKKDLIQGLINGLLGGN